MSYEIRTPNGKEKIDTVDSIDVARDRISGTDNVIVYTGESIQALEERKYRGMYSTTSDGVRVAWFPNGLLGDFGTLWVHKVGGVEYYQWPNVFRSRTKEDLAKKGEYYLANRIGKQGMITHPIAS